VPRLVFDFSPQRWEKFAWPEALAKLFSEQGGEKLSYLISCADLGRTGLGHGVSRSESKKRLGILGYVADCGNIDIPTLIFDRKLRGFKSND
jgi:hypothetical protein